MARHGQSQGEEARRRGRGTGRRGRVLRPRAALVDIVVGAVNRLGWPTGASLADIERVALASGDLPVRAGVRSVLRLGVGHAVELGRLERLPGGLYQVPVIDVIDDDSIHHENLGVQTESAVENSTKTSNFASTCTTSVECEVKNIQTDVVGEFIPQHLQQLYFPPQPVNSTKEDAFFQHLIFDGMDGDIFGNDVEGGDGGVGGGAGGGGQGTGAVTEGEHSAGDHARAASAGLFKLSSDIITTIVHTAFSRLDFIGSRDGGGDGAGGGGVSAQGVGVDLFQDPDADPDADACPRRGGGRGGGGRGGGKAAETRMVVRTTGTALAEIARAASEGARRVLDVAFAERADEAIASVETKEAIFRVFKEAAIDIVRAARTFGEALRNDVVEGLDRQAPRFEPTDSDQGDAYESLY